MEPRVTVDNINMTSKSQPDLYPTTLSNGSVSIQQANITNQRVSSNNIETIDIIELQQVLIWSS